MASNEETNDVKKTIGAWHSRTLERSPDEEVTLTVGELRTLLWALNTVVSRTGRNARDIDYNLGEIAKLKEARGLGAPSRAGTGGKTG